jgi:hypothetical protein
MRTHTEPDQQAEREASHRPDPATRSPSWPMALASVAVCLGTGAAIALIAILA